jgi:hypothetical protein
MKIKGIARRQNHATTAARLRMVDQFRRSGLTRAAYCQQHGIPLATLAWWLARAKRTSNLPAPVVFSEIMLPPAPATATSGWAMEIVRPDGLVIRFREALGANEVARMLRGPQC